VPIKPYNGLVGFVSLVLDESVYLGSIAVYTRLTGGYRLVYPTKRAGTKEINIFYPINKLLGNEIEYLVSEKFEEVMNNDRHSGFNNAG
jgi:stage V sporulation protein G